MLPVPKDQQLTFLVHDLRMQLESCSSGISDTDSRASAPESDSSYSTSDTDSYTTESDDSSDDTSECSTEPHTASLDSNSRAHSTSPEPRLHFTSPQKAAEEEAENYMKSLDDVIMAEVEVWNYWLQS